MTWTTSRDGEQRVTIRVDYRLTLDEVAGAIADVEDVCGHDLDDVPAAELREDVRRLLRGDGRAITDHPHEERHVRAAVRAFGQPAN